MPTTTQTQQLFVDVRPPEVYKNGHIPGAVNVPLNVLETLDKQMSDKQAPISVYCQDGIRSAKGAALLRELGYTNVTDYGPITNWDGKLDQS